MSEHYSDLNYPPGMGTQNTPNVNHVENFDDWAFHEFMEEQDGFDRCGWHWTNGTVRYHSEKRPGRHFIARRKRKAGEWIYDKTWNSLEDFQGDFPHPRW